MENVNTDAKVVLRPVIPNQTKVRLLTLFYHNSKIKTDF